MNGRYFAFGNSRNPLAQALSLAVLAVLLVGAVIMGAFVLMAVSGFAAIALLGFTLRNWWLRRQARGRGPNDGGGCVPGPPNGIRYIEGEYEVIDADADTERRRSGERP